MLEINNNLRNKGRQRMNNTSREMEEYLFFNSILERISRSIFNDYRSLLPTESTYLYFKMSCNEMSIYWYQCFKDGEKGCIKVPIEVIDNNSYCEWVSNIKRDKRIKFLKIEISVLEENIEDWSCLLQMQRRKLKKSNMLKAEKTISYYSSEIGDSKKDLFRYRKELNALKSQNL